MPPPLPVHVDAPPSNAPGLQISARPVPQIPDAVEILIAIAGVAVFSCLVHKREVADICRVLSSAAASTSSIIMPSNGGPAAA